MLTRELAIVEYRDMQAFPDKLSARKHAHYVNYAQRMCDVYARSRGLTRREIHRAIHNIFALEPECPPRRIDAFCKLLDEVSLYDSDDAGTAARLRQQVYLAAAPMHPLVTTADPWFEHNEHQAKQQIAEQLGKSWEEIEARLFADIIDFRRLKEFTGYEDPKQLLARYNVAQTQVALYDAARMTVWATTDFKSILRYAKLARLMHTIRKAPEGYRFDFDGPASFMHRTQRYGVMMAKFLPGLLSCRGWKMQAALLPRGWRGRVTLHLDSQCGLSSPIPAPAEFDSAVEETFFTRWGNEPRDGWTLTRETEILHHGQTVFMPDFVLKHESGKNVFLEVVGFWTPEYLAAKRQSLKQFPDHRMLLAVSEQAKEQLADTGPEIVPYKTVIRVDAVLAALHTFAL
jgi:predicted nuclease of restriction endonuclease-like RecB superfamily